MFSRSEALPLSLSPSRRPGRGLTVAVIGPDGAGKTTVCRRIVDSAPSAVRYLYMGVSRDSSNRMLPTTRLIHFIKKLCGARPDTAGPRQRDEGSAEHDGQSARRGVVRRGLRFCKSMAGLAVRLGEEWYRQLLAGYYRRRGFLVLFDRHFYVDYYAYDIGPQRQQRDKAERSEESTRQQSKSGSPLSALRSPLVSLPLSRRIHGWVLVHLYPRPDLVIYLDAPAEVLFARKGEGSVALLEQRRHDYLQMREVLDYFEVVDADRPAEEVVGDVRERIAAFTSDRSPAVSSV